MLRHLLWLFPFLFLGAFSIPANAQDTATIRTSNGYIVEYPADWDVNLSDENGNIVLFDDGSMYGIISMLDYTDIDETPQEVVAGLAESIQEDGEGIFGDIEEYRLLDRYPTARSQRLTETDNLTELLLATEIDDISIAIRATMRVGSLVDYLPLFEQMATSVILEGREDRRIRYGSPENILDFTDLDTTSDFDAKGFSLTHPQSWSFTELEDSVEFLSQGEITVIGEIFVQTREDFSGRITPEAVLDARLRRESGRADYGDIETFSLNGLAAARAYREDSRAGTTDLVMTMLRGELVVTMRVTVNTGQLVDVEALLRAVLFSVRPLGEELEYNIIGSGARLGLLSGLVYGNANLSGDASLPNQFVSSDGTFSYNYPADWVQDIDLGDSPVLTNQTGVGEDLQEGQIVIYISYFPFTGIFTSPEAALRDLNAETDLTWGEIQSIEVDGRPAAYVENDPSDFNGLIAGTYVTELYADEDLYVRLTVLGAPEDVAANTPILRSILASARYQP